MTPKETVLLTRYVKACCPQQQIDEYTPDAWYDILGDLDLDDCRTAVVAIKKRAVFVDPSEIRAEVKRIRRDRLDREIIPAPPAEPGPYKAELDASIKRIAEGRSVHLAIGGPVREGPPPEEWTEARKTRGAALPGRDKALTSQEKALQQVAESRARRRATEDAAEPDDAEPAA